MKIGRYQLAVSIIVGVMLVASFIIPDAQPSASNAESRTERQIDALLNGSQLEVRDALGAPQSTSELLQGSPSTQNPSSSQVEQPSDGLLEYLQPNSGQSSFNSQRSDVQ